MSDLALLCNPYHRGGITRWMADLAIEWPRSTGGMWFVAPRPRTPFVTGKGRRTMLELLQGHEHAGLHVVAPEVGATFEFGTTAYRGRIYAKAIEQGVPAGVPLVVSDDPAAWLAAASLSGRNPLVGVLHNDDPTYYDLLKRFGPWVAAVVGVSERVTARARAQGSAGHAPVRTIPCGIALQPLQRLSAESRRGALRIAWIGRVEEAQKRISDLPRIALALRTLGLDFMLEIMGSGPDEAALAEKIASSGLSDRVRLLGWGSSDQVRDLLAASDLLIIPSNFEGMPIVVMEALSMGCGVIGSRVSGIEDYERHPSAQLCFWVHEVGDVTAAARLVAQACAASAAERVAAARALAEREFSIAACARRYAELLPQLAPTASMIEGSVLRRPLIPLASYAVAAQRIARVWTAGRYRKALSPSSAA